MGQVAVSHQQPPGEGIERLMSMANKPILNHDAEYTTRLHRWATLNKKRITHTLTAREQQEMKVLDAELDEIEQRKLRVVAG